MRPLKFLAHTIACGLALTSLVSAQSSTPILGFYKFTAPTGNSLWTAGLITKTDFQSKATSVVSGTPNSTINQAAPAWTPGTTFPLHYVEFLDDPATPAVEPWTGLILDIQGNTDNALTVKGTLSAFTGLGATPLYCIRKHATLGTLFVNGAGLEEFSDVVTLYEPDGTIGTHAYIGSGAFVDGTGALSTDTIVYPGQGFILTISAAAGREITIGGGEVAYVKSTPTKIPLYKFPPGSKGVNLLGPVTPLVATNPLDPIFPSTIPMSQTGILGSSLEPFGEFLTVYTIEGSLGTSGVFTIGDLGAGTVVIDGNGAESNNTPFKRGQSFNVTVNNEKYSPPR